MRTICVIINTTYEIRPVIYALKQICKVTLVYDFPYEMEEKMSFSTCISLTYLKFKSYHSSNIFNFNIYY